MAKPSTSEIIPRRNCPPPPPPCSDTGACHNSPTARGWREELGRLRGRPHFFFSKTKTAPGTVQLPSTSNGRALPSDRPRFHYGPTPLLIPWGGGVADARELRGSRGGHRAEGLAPIRSTVPLAAGAGLNGICNRQ